jgi:hypothetical protein
MLECTMDVVPDLPRVPVREGTENARMKSSRHFHSVAFPASLREEVRAGRSHTLPLHAGLVVCDPPSAYRPRHP